MKPLLLRETRDPQNLGHDGVEVIVELDEGGAKQVRRTSAQQVVDLVVKTKLNLGVVHFLQSLAHFFQRLQLLLNEIRREVQLLATSPPSCPSDPLQQGKGPLRDGSATRSRSSSHSSKGHEHEHIVHILHFTNDGPIVQVPDAQVQIWELLLNLQSERMQNEREK